MTPAAGSGERAERPLWALALGVTAVTTALRLDVARHIGFGDAEALYLLYARHPQPAYLDHPGLVGQVAAWFGAEPAPFAVHAFTAVVAALVPWLAALAARAAGASVARALVLVPALALMPQVAIGLVALTPDALLAPLWLLGLAAGLRWLAAPVGGRAALGWALATGVAVGFGALAKVSGALLALAVLGATLGAGQRARWRTAEPWAALGVVAILAAPVVLWELAQGFPMVTHRLVSTQARAGFGLRNLAALVGGQLAYAGPATCAVGFLVIRGLWGRRGGGVAAVGPQPGPPGAEPAVATIGSPGEAAASARIPAVPGAVALLRWTAAVAGVVLGGLCLWSRVAEPHWLAPLWLTLAVALPASLRAVPRWAARLHLGLGALVLVVGWGWVATELPPRWLGALYQPRYDLATDLHAWSAVRGPLREELAALGAVDEAPVLVGPHWIVCAQAALAAGPAVPVGCATPLPDDFDRWHPRATWRRAPVLLVVSDARFDVAPTALAPEHGVVRRRTVEVVRGGRVVRTVTLTVLQREARASF